MRKPYKIATIFGGSGFIGKQVVRELARAGYLIKVATRVPERAYELRPCGTVGQVVPFECHYGDPASIAAAVAGAEVVVNCIGILYERKKGDFKRAHAEIPAMIAEACVKAEVKSFIHISAAGIEISKSRYAKTKLEGENAIRKIMSDVTILRPSIVFGPDDDFFNKFAGLMQILPALPLIGGGRTLFQPVYVGDIADAVMAAIKTPDHHRGRVYELGGPEIVSFKEIYKILERYTGHRRIYFYLPWILAKIDAFFLSLLPTPLLTPDQVESLKSDFTVSPQSPGLAELGLRPTGMEMILPQYLAAYRAGGRFGALKQA